MLEHRDFTRLEVAGSTRIYTFKHNITQEVAYQTLLESQLRELHLAVAQTLEQQQEQNIEDLAYHFHKSDLRQTAVRAKAVHYLQLAGEKARRRYANETALSFFERALRIETRWEWLKAKIEILHVLGLRREEAAALEVMAKAPDAPVFVLAYLHGQYHEAINDYEQAAADINTALLASKRVADRQGEARALVFIGQIYRRYGRYDKAQEYYLRALGILQADGKKQKELGDVLYGLGIVDRQQGSYTEAHEQLTGALALFRAVEDRRQEALALTALGGLAHLRRNFDQALDYYRQALAIRQMIGDRAGEGGSLLSIGQVMRSVGKFGEAARLLQQSLAIQQALYDRWWENRIWNELGIVYMLVGQLAEARNCFERGLSLADVIGDEAGAAVLTLNLGQTVRELGLCTKLRFC